MNKFFSFYNYETVNFINLLYLLHLFTEILNRRVKKISKGNTDFFIYKKEMKTSVVELNLDLSIPFNRNFNRKPKNLRIVANQYQDL